MSRLRLFAAFVPAVSILAALSLSAMAEEPPKKPAPKAPTVQQKGPVGPGPQVGHGPPARGGPAARAAEHHPMGRDPGHWSERERYAWGHGSWRPYACRFGRCGYWWWADGYWYFYDHPMEGPPVEVSAYAYPDPEPPSAPGYVEAPPPPPPPPPGSSVLGGAVGGSIIGGILGGALTGRPAGAAIGAIIGGTTGAAIGAQAEQRNGYYFYQGACYYRYPTGEFAVIDPSYCN